MSNLKNYYRELLRSFYQKNHSTLEKNYPGISLRTLEQTLKELPTPLPALGQFFENLKAGKPLSYLTQKHFFYEDYFFVSPEVLIPRVETEYLCELIIAEGQKKTFTRVLDLACGSGAIGITLALHLPQIKNLVLSDLCLGALKIARHNVQSFSYRYACDVQVRESDRFSALVGQFDLIVSNPPYIPHSKKNLVHPQVTRYEPHKALFLPDEEYEEWFYKFFTDLRKFLKPQGQFWMEGHEHQWDKITKIAKKVGLTGTLIQDLTGAPRYLQGGGSDSFKKNCF